MGGGWKSGGIGNVERGSTEMKGIWRRGTDRRTEGRENGK